MFNASYHNGNNEVLEIFNEKCVICFERDSVNAIRQCGHECMCESFYRNKGDKDALNCVVCRQGWVR